MTNLWILFAAAVASGTHPAHPVAPDWPTCANVYRAEVLSLPIFPGFTGFPTSGRSDVLQDYPFALAFVRLGDWSRTDLPVIVEVPGGPGGGGIGEESALVKALGIADWPRLVYDPRGANCSPLSFSMLGEARSHDALDSALSAGDVVALIRALGLQRYVIYGQSFGTLLATHVVAQLQAARLRLPEAVVLDGTIGRYGELPSGANDGDVAVWNRVRARLPAAVLQRLEHEVEPWGVSRLAWGGDIRKILELDYSGAIALEVLTARYSSLVNENSKQARQVLASLKAWRPAQSAADFAFGGSEFYAASVLCRELDSHWVLNPILTGLELDYQGAPADALLRICDSETLTRPFDSASFSLRPPLVYLQGSDDVQTSLQTARYHFENQTHAQRLWVEVAGVGHGVVPTAWGTHCGAALSAYLRRPTRAALGQLAAELRGCDPDTRTELRD